MFFCIFLSIVSSQVEVSMLTSGIHKCIANKVKFDAETTPCRRPWPLSFLPSATLHLLPEARSLSKIYDDLWMSARDVRMFTKVTKMKARIWVGTCSFSFYLLLFLSPFVLLSSCTCTVLGKCTSGMLSLVINLFACYREMHIRRGVLVLLCSYCCREINARHGVFGGVVLLA